MQENHYLHLSFFFVFCIFANLVVCEKKLKIKKNKKISTVVDFVANNNKGLCDVSLICLKNEMFIFVFKFVFFLGYCKFDICKYKTKQNMKSFTPHNNSNSPLCFIWVFVIVQKSQPLLFLFICICLLVVCILVGHFQLLLPINIVMVLLLLCRVPCWLMCCGNFGEQFRNLIRVRKTNIIQILQLCKFSNKNMYIQYE